jgi:type I restriction enzyme M protein
MDILNSATRSKIDRLWDSFWSGGISNPLTVVEQISYLLFIRRLGDREDLKEKMANRTGQKFVSTFPDDNYRWKNFKNIEAQTMYDLMLQKIFPFIKTLSNGDSAFTQSMKDAVFLIQKPSLLFEAVQLIDGIDMDDQDTKGDLYEYLLSKLQISGVNGQFRTPRHIIKMMVELLDPSIEDKICDPACGTAGFLVAATEHILQKYTSPEAVFTDDEGNVHNKIGDKLPNWDYFKKEMFSGFDFDSSMLRISAMNMMLHGVEAPNIFYADCLSSGYDENRKYTMVLANPPFKGNLDEKDIHPKLKSVVSTKKTELLFLALFLRILDLGGRCACIVPDGVLFGSSNAHKELRRLLVEENQLEAMISMPAGVFKPYAGVSTGILIFTKGGRTDHVWLYDMQADGLSLDDKRDPIEANDIPDILKRWKERDPKKDTDRTEKAFFVPKVEIVENGYDLSLNRYKQVVHEEVEYEAPKVILAKLKELEAEIVKELDELEKMVG